MICKVGLGWLLRKLRCLISWFSIGLMILFIKLYGVSIKSLHVYPPITDFGLVSIFIFVVTVIFALPVRWFAWFEYIASLLKISAFLLVVVASICILAGAGPTGHAHGSEAWQSFPIFTNGFRVSYTSKPPLNIPLTQPGIFKRHITRHMGNRRPSIHRNHGRRSHFPSIFHGSRHQTRSGTGNVCVHHRYHSDQLSRFGK